MRDVIKVKVADDFLNVLVERGFAAADPGQLQRVADDVAIGTGMGADPNVVEHRKIGKQRDIWKVRPMPISAIRCGGRVRMLTPSIRMSPVLGW